MVGNGLRIAKVIKSQPEANSVDIVYVDTGARVPSVQVMGDANVADIPHVEEPADMERPLAKTGRDVFAVVADLRGVPLVLGFLKAQVAQILFRGRPNFRVIDHASEVYETLEDDGSYTHAWPNGSFLKMGTTPDQENLTGKDFDKKWKRTRNTEQPMYLSLVLKSAGEEAFSLRVTPDGNATFEVEGDLNLTVRGNITSSAPNWSHTGDMQIDGDLDVTGTVTGQEDVIADDISGKGHRHTSAGPGSPTSPPLPS